jgi:hypothetical protein
MISMAGCCSSQSEVPSAERSAKTSITSRRSRSTTVKAWLARHNRFHLHFTPTSASPINQVERFFGLITDEAIRCGAFRSVADLEAAIERYPQRHNADPKPFVWTAEDADILKKVARCETSVGITALGLPC